MANDILAQKFVTEDGAQFDTKAEAMDYLRKPLKAAALNALNGNNQDLTDWLLNFQDEVEAGFESAKIRRVSKSERKQLDKALEAIVASGDKAFAFIIDNAAVVAESFRWPTVKRVDAEVQSAAIKAGFMTLTDNNQSLVDWLLANKDAVLEAYQAGVQKREVSPKATEALAAYRAKKAAEKAEAEAAAAKAAE